ncbi:complement component 1, q subcomponent-like 4 like [Hoplias malabaricus]|uniref:complement component 1, q subcomponent-like 4 like n=1 Tax=Hoplias malabaricus TaxID=27720 RepID=UPI0034621789
MLFRAHSATVVPTFGRNTAGSDAVRVKMAKCALQLALMLTLWATEAQEFMSPTLNIIEELGKLKDMEDRLKTLEESVRTQNGVVEQLQKENGDLKSTVETLQREKEDLEKVVETLRNEKEVRKVAFSASLLASGSGHTGPLQSVTSPLIYKSVHTNIGNGYNSDTGVFTAPLKGVYYFRFYAHSHDGIRMAVSLFKNDTVQCSVFSWKPVSNGNAGNGVVLALDQGDRIFTKLWKDSWVYDDPGRFTSFGGFLLFPL